MPRDNRDNEEEYDVPRHRSPTAGMKRRRARDVVPSARIKKAYRDEWTVRTKSGKRKKKPNAPSLRSYAQEMGGAGHDWLKNKKKK